MSEEQTPLWRQALTEKTHPLNTAAWLLFAEKMNVKYATKRLTEQKDAVIQLIQSIFDDYEVLVMEDSMGEGCAPGNAAKLAAAWKLTQFLPLMLNVIRDEEPGTYIHDDTNQALQDFGPEIIPDVLAYQEANNDEPFLYISTVFILSAVGKKDERVFNFIYERFQQAEGDDIEIMATALLECDSERAIPIIEEWMQQKQNLRKLDNRLKKIMPTLIQDARDGKL